MTDAALLALGYDLDRAWRGGALLPSRDSGIHPLTTAGARDGVSGQSLFTVRHQQRLAQLARQAAQGAAIAQDDDHTDALARAARTRAFWTPERRAAQAARIQEYNARRGLSQTVSARYQRARRARQRTQAGAAA